MNNIEKVIIIGGGSSGLSAAIYASRAMLNPLLFEGEPGGQLMLTSDVENYPGFENPILGPELMQNFKKQALRFGTKIVSSKITSIQKKDKLIELKDNLGNTYLTQSLLLATGAQAKWLNIPGEEKLRGKGVSACATCDGFFFKDKHIVVVGGGDSAMEEASYHTKFASKVTLIHRRNEFKASVYMVNKVKANPKIELLLETEVKEVLGEDKLTGIMISGPNGLANFDCEGLFVAIGHQPSTSFLQNSGVKMDSKGYIFTTERVRFEKNIELDKEYKSSYRYQTNIEGVFAAGDCVDYTYRQAGTAVGSAIAAVLEIEQFLSSQ